MSSRRISFGLSTAAALFLYVGIVRSRRRTYINILDDDSLLNIFYHCMPLVFHLEEGFGDNSVLWGTTWGCERWWYKLASVCRRWRRLILASPSYLGISLVWMSGATIADMLAHSPTFPLIIDHIPMLERDNAKIEERLFLALKHRDRVSRIRIWVDDFPPWERLTEAISEEFPLLEYLYLRPLARVNTNLSLPSTLRAPHLRHLVLLGFAFPIGSPLLAGLVTLTIESINLSANFGPSELLQQLSLMPHLEAFRISFDPALFNQYVERQLLQMPSPTHVTLPALRWFGFGRPSPYIEAVLLRITTPLLGVTEIMSESESSLDLTFSVLFTLQTVYKAKNPRFCNVKVMFHDVHIAVVMDPHQRIGMSTLRFRSPSFDIDSDRMLDFTVQIFNGIGTVLNEVEMLTLEDKASWAPHEGFATHTGWRDLLRSFNQVRTLHVSGGDLIKGLSHSLRPHDGESAIELLPMLRVLSCPKPEGTHVSESCRSFLAARQNAGTPVTISHC